MERLFWRIKENLQKHFLHSPICLIASGKHAWQEEEETRIFFSTVLIVQEHFFTSELFKVIPDAISLILRYRTMSILWTVSSSTFVTSDVQSICILSSVRD